MVCNKNKVKHPKRTRKVRNRSSSPRPQVLRPVNWLKHCENIDSAEK